MQQRSAVIWNLDHDVPRNTRTLEPVLVLESNRRKAKCSYMALPLLRRSAIAQGEGPAARALDVWRLQGSPATVLLVPAEPRKDNLPVVWRKGGAQAQVDLRRLLTVHPFEVPPGSTAYIPLYLREEEGEPGLCLEVRFGETAFEPRRSGRNANGRRKERQR